MIFLQNFSRTGTKTALALFVICILSLAAVAQKVGPQQQEGKRYGDPGFRGEPINLNVVNADIRDILSYITEQYGVNFVIDKSVKNVPVTVNVSDVPWNIALDSILQSQDLGVQVNGPILRVAERQTLAGEGEVERRRKDNQLESVPLYTEFIRLNFARAAGTIGGSAGGAGSFAGGVQSGQSAGGGTGGVGEQGILPIIKKRLSRRGSVEVEGRSNTLIITDVRENLDSVRQLIAFLDQPEPQVEIESRIVVASRSFTRDLGVQLSAVLVQAGSNGAGGVFSTLPGDNSPPNGPTLPGQPNGTLGAAANTIFGLTTGLIGTARINALLTAGESKGQAKTIATPRVTTLNNRSATIESGSQIPITTVQPGAAAGGAVVVTTEYINVPLRLAVTPQISDAGSVLLNVVAENNSVSFTEGGGTPPISTQRMQTEVMVPDGGTTIVGGALLDVESERQNRTPGLSRIPIFGNLFKRKAVSRGTDEIIFFITPRIIRSDIKVPVDNNNRTTLIQPVPLGNPSTNTTVPETTPTTAPPSTTPVVTPLTQPLVVQPQVQPQATPARPN
jgi:type IV pilus assembly protein PilQ